VWSARERASCSGFLAIQGVCGEILWFGNETFSDAESRFGTHFGNSSADVNIPSLNPDTLGVYAGTNGGNNASLVIVNKDPNNAVALNLSGLPNGMYFLRHFGGQAGIAKYQVCTGQLGR
jgi:hypothetical protein